jgi:hypothetical protein
MSDELTYAVKCDECEIEWVEELPPLHAEESDERAETWPACCGVRADLMHVLVPVAT